MEHTTDSPELLETLMYPAFTVKDGIILHLNQAASQYGIQKDCQVADIISVGKDDYAAYTSGKLCLVLCVEGITHNATVIATDTFHLFCMESDYTQPELRAFALAAQQLRGPLSSAMASTDLLLPGNQSTEDLKHIAQINHSLYQLLRIVSNMSDAAAYAGNQLTQMELSNAVSIFDEVLEKASVIAEKANRTIRYKSVCKDVPSLIDAEKVQRAVLNIISNAMKFSAKESTIDAQLRVTDTHFIFSVWDNSPIKQRLPLGDMFSRFLRQPGLEDNRTGIGLGLSIIRSVAASHKGTVLLEQPENAGLKITMTIARQLPQKNQFHSPVRLPIDHTGGRDICLLELSDTLPASLYNETV